MKNIVSRMVVIGSLAGFLAVASGCSSNQHPKPDSGGGVTAFDMMGQQQAVDQSLVQLKNLPPDQRQAYVDAHPEVVEQLQADPDKSKMDVYRSLMPDRIPDRTQ